MVATSRPSRSRQPSVPPSVTRRALLIGGDDRRFRQFIDTLIRLSARLQALRAALARAVGVTSPQYNILMILARTPAADGEPMGNIARQLGVSLSFVVAETRALAAQGLLRLSRNPRDRRSVLATLTREGHGRIRRAATQIQRVNDLLFASLTRAELVQVDRAIAKVLKDSEAALAAAGRKPGAA